jgi:hypothetical protein
LQNPSQINGDNLNNVRNEVRKTFRIERGNIHKTTNALQTVRTKISDTYIEALMNLRFTNLELKG